MSITSTLNHRVFQTVFLGYSALLLFLGRQADTGLLNFDDSYYAQKAKELLAGGSLWFNTYHGVPDFDKPPLPLWLTAAAFKCFGVSGYSAVLVTGLLGAATVYLTYRFSEILFADDRWAAFLAGIVLIFPGYFLDYSRRGMTDIVLAFFVTLAMFCFVQARRNPRWYLGFGASTAAAILTKSVLGLFPLMIALSMLTFARRWREMINPFFVISVVLALGLGSVWHLVNWMEHGDRFLTDHFGWIIWQRFSQGDPATPASGPFYFLGYLGAFAKNYWPWLPFAVAGLWIFGRKAFREREERSLLVVLWIVIPLAVLSVSRAQYFRYMLPVFPALALLVSQTLSGWLRKDWKDKMLPWLAGSIMITVLVINATPVEFRQTATLHQNSPAVRALAPVIRLNTPEVLLNFRLPDWNPRNAVLFYTDRWMPNHVEEAEAVMRSLEADAGATWLTSVKSFAELTARFPGRLYLIQAQGPYAYFTSARFRDRVRYDFSGKNEPGVR